MTVKLFNKGERTIIHGEFHLKPNMTGAFPEEVATKLTRLFGNELVSLEGEIKRFDELQAQDATKETSSKKAK